MPNSPQSQPPQTAKVKSKLSIINSASSPGFKVDVLAYQELAGSNDPSTAQSIYYANQTGLRLKQVRISLNQGEAVAEAGTLHYMHGNLELSK